MKPVLVMKNSRKIVSVKVLVLMVFNTTISFIFKSPVKSKVPLKVQEFKIWTIEYCYSYISTGNSKRCGF